MTRSTTTLTIPVMIAALCTATYGLCAHAQETSRTLPTDFPARLQTLAMQLSSYVADGDSRAFLTTLVKESPRKNIIVLRDFLDAAIDRDSEASGKLLAEIAAQVYETEEAMRAAKMPVSRLDLKLAVKAHRDTLNTADVLYVAAVPLEDESEVTSIIAWSKGERIELSTAEPPKIPTLIVTPGESESVDPEYPLTITDQPGDEANKGRVVDDFIGIAYIRILDDHESWPSGDPEIYVRILRCSQGRWRHERRNLASVNDENVWYWLGDPNSTYRFVNCGSTVHMNFYEEDSGAHGNDDYVGTCQIAWRQLPFGGYRQPSCYGDVRIFVDRD